MSQIFGSGNKKTDYRNGNPIEWKGLWFYPIKMSHYEKFMECKNIISLRMSTLPVKYFAMGYASGLFSFDIDSAIKENKSAGFIHRFMEMLCLSLRIEIDMKNIDDVVRLKREDGNIVLEKLCVTQNGKLVELSPNDLSFGVRNIIAQQNGLEIPDESENPDLVGDYEMKKSLSAKSNLNANLEDLIASVAYLSNITEHEINNWSVVEFERRRRAIERDKLYMIYAQAEMGGMISFKNGNPVPSWCYDSIDDSLGTMSLSKVPLGSAKEQKN